METGAREPLYCSCLGGRIGSGKHNFLVLKSINGFLPLSSFLGRQLQSLLLETGFLEPQKHVEEREMILWLKGKRRNEHKDVVEREETKGAY